VFQAQNAARDATDLVSKLMTWHHTALTDPNKHANNTRYFTKSTEQRITIQFFNKLYFLN
jgi:hypothetical protein